MYESKNKRVQKIVNLIQMDGRVVKDKKITLDELPHLCQNLNDSDKKEIASLIEAIAEELDVLCDEREYLDAQINPLKAVKEKLTKLV
jgi:hypothetical protein